MDKSDNALSNVHVASQASTIEISCAPNVFGSFFIALLKGSQEAIKTKS
jgi:hypothetical protein